MRGEGEAGPRHHASPSSPCSLGEEPPPPDTSPQALSANLQPEDPLLVTVPSSGHTIQFRPMSQFFFFFLETFRKEDTLFLRELLGEIFSVTAGHRQGNTQPVCNLSCFQPVCKHAGSQL